MEVELSSADGRWEWQRLLVHGGRDDVRRNRGVQEERGGVGWMVVVQSRRAEGRQEREGIRV